MKFTQVSIAFLTLYNISGVAFADTQQAFSDAELEKLANNKYAANELPLGDGHYMLDAPRKGYIWLCHPMSDGRGGANHDGPWIHGNTWSLRDKLSVQGYVVWKEAQFLNTLNGSERVFSGNGLPIDHATGIFPIQPSDPAYAYDRNPNSIRMQEVRESLPADPIYTDSAYCMGMEVGYMLNGVPLFNGFDAGLRDAAAHEVQDACQGHPQMSGSYHYHSLSSCIKDVSVKTVIGYALDGFPITGPQVKPGKYLTTDDLDICHGLTSEILQDGQKKVTYHYVMTMDFPYSVSCFRAKPVRLGPSGQQPGAQQPMPKGPPPGGMNKARPRPPKEALDACNDKVDGNACDFTSPYGDYITGTCHAPPQMPLACIPDRGPPPR
jgi:hypothetical protein